MDSFFGFDTGLPATDESGDTVRHTGRSSGRNHNSEDEYDALNDETFGEPDKGDWENIHESLVRLEQGDGLLHHNKVVNENKLQHSDDELELNWSRFDFCDEEESISSAADLSLDEDISTKLRLDPSIWNSPNRKAAPLQQQNSFGLSSIIPNTSFGLAKIKPIAAYNVECQSPQLPVKMLSVEDVERNIIQQQQKQRIKDREQKKFLEKSRKSTNTKKSITVQPTVKLPLQPLVPPAQLLAVRSQLFPPPPVMNHQTRLPIGYLPYSFLPAHYATPINNFSLHPGIPTATHQLGLFQHQRFPLTIQPQLIQQNMQNNQFNERLVQEIQQNHPMLLFNRQNHLYNNHQNNHKHQQRYSHSKGTDYDEYANLMTNREKQWLVGIQLTQLNSDTPYINDYYFTVYKERLASLKGNGESKTYQDNKLNHPFTQPKGHAQLLLMSSLARNCGLYSNRERKSSESKNNNDQKDQSRTYTPLQFENSLGKLQCGSVTAPRKIIDMDVVGNESPVNASLELSMQRKSRHVLLHIETVFKLVLKMEDMINPIAIEAISLAKEKREREIQEMATDSSPSSSTDSETFDELMTALKNALTQERVTQMLAIRKGKILLRRIFVLLRENPCRWSLWTVVFSSIPFLSKRDRDDCEGVLFALYTEFERHVQYSKPLELLCLTKIIATEKILLHLTGCKFLLSSIITIIFQMETFFARNAATDLTPDEQDQWIQCLETITVTITKLLRTTSAIAAQHAIKIDPDNNIILTIRTHMERFSQRVEGRNFLHFITSDSTGRTSMTADRDDKTH
ncbi:protein PAT1 homolog 1-like [Sabethes cyaneus]|uniref:protein PAT1 homolog 1-like n=1 Tax=Sabethes cyaneus TaxID=53552 RepID=UPI00237D9185|nr:protein PAT1 homolog 1-like [Sabethes cyaneus]